MCFILHSPFSTLHSNQFIIKIMASLFANISELQAHLGGAINASVKMAHIAPYIDNAYTNHLQMWTGDAIWDAAVAAHGGGSPTAEQQDLVEKIQAALAPLAYTGYAAFADIQFSGSGRYRTETGEMKTPFRYQVREANDRMLNMGYQALERLVLFLEENTATYTDWPGAPGYGLHHSILLHTAILFQTNNGQRMGRYGFEIVRPVVQEVEQFVLVPLLTEELYQQLLDNRRAGTLTGNEKVLMGHTYRCTAHFVLQEALQRQLVQLKDGKVVQYSTEEKQAYRSTAPAPVQGLAIRLGRHNLFANRHYVAINNFLDANIDVPEFAGYKAKVEAGAVEPEEGTVPNVPSRPQGVTRL